MITNLYQRNTSGVFKTIKRKYNQLNLRTHDIYIINVKYFDNDVITARNKLEKHTWNLDIMH